MAGKEPTRVWVDKFAPMQLAREYRLSAVEAYALLVLTLLADWHSRSWVGTVAELAADLRVSRSTAAAAVGRLQSLGLIEIAEPFQRNRPGLVVVNVYNRLTQRRSVAPLSTGYETNMYSPSNETDDVTGSDQQIRASSKDKGAIKEEGPRASHSLRGKPTLGAEITKRQFPSAEEVG